MLSLLRRNRSTIGLDIGSSSVKATVIDHAGARPEITHVARVPLDGSAVVEGEVVDPKMAAEAVRVLFAEARIKPGRVAISVGGRDLIVKRIQMDRMQPEYVRDVIRWEAEQYVPFDMKNVQLDFQVLDPDGDGLQMDVLLVAAKRDMIEQKLAVLREAGVTVSVVDVDAFALHNAFAHNYPDAMQGTVVLINVGHELSTVNLLNDGVPVLTRDLPFGTRRLREELEQSHGMSAEEADAVLQGRSDRHREGQALLAAASEDLAAGIERAAAFHAIGNGERALGRVYLCGGGANIPGLVAAVADRLRVRTEVANPLARLPLQPGAAAGFPIDELASMMMLSVGLALRSAA
jgi:type IV pilus assembly protein PilM